MHKFAQAMFSIQISGIDDHSRPPLYAIWVQMIFPCKRKMPFSSSPESSILQNIPKRKYVCSDEQFLKDVNQGNLIEEKSAFASYSQMKVYMTFDMILKIFSQRMPIRNIHQGQRHNIAVKNSTINDMKVKH